MFSYYYNQKILNMMIRAILSLRLLIGKFRGTNFIYTLKTNNNLLIPVFVHSHHVHQHEIDEKFGIKRPINIDHIVCF